MKRNLLKFLLLGVFMIILCSPKRASAAQVVFTGLAGNSPIYLTQGVTNDVVFGFSVFVPASGTFNPGPVHIAQSNSTNGFITGNLVRTTAANPSLAISAPQATYGAAINGTIDINGFPTLTGAAGTGTTYYFYLVLSITTTLNPPPASVIFSLPASASISQNGYGGGITVTNLASPTTYYFGINPPTVPAASNCGTGTVTMTASDASPSGGTYAWYTVATGGVPVSASATYTTPSISTSTTYYVAYTYNLQTSSRTAATATINPIPSATFTSTATIGTGTSPTVTYTGTDPSTSTYAWSFTGASPATGSGQSPAVVTYSTPGTYTITLNITNSAGCTATSSNTITVISPPTASPVTQCGAGATLTASDVTSGGTYNWYTAATGGTAIATGATLSNIQSTATYYVSYTYGGFTTTRTAVTATIYPTVSSPLPSSSFAYPFNAGSTADITGNGNTATASYQTTAQTEGTSTGPPTTSADRFGAANSAYTFDGKGQYMYTTTKYTDPTTYTLSLWFKTTTTYGGKLIGFDSSLPPGSGQFDRHIYMTNAGLLIYGVYSGATLTISSTLAYNDGNWHHVVVTQSPTAGAVMYVDGVSVASNATITAPETDNGYWRIGGDNLGGWPSSPTSSYFAGSIDDVSVYSVAQTAAVVAASNNLNLIGFPPTATCVNSPITFSAQTITGATYTWTDASGNTMTGQNPTFPSAISGSYTLSVTGGPGGCSSTATVTPTFNAAPSATFTSPASINAGSTATVTYTGTDPSTSTYAWTFTGATPATGSGQSPAAVTYSTAGTYTITLTITNSNGCTATSSNTIAVIAPPTASPVTQCGAGATLTASDVVSGGTYNWYTVATGGTAIQSSSSPTLSGILSTGTYYVSYTYGSATSTRTAVTATINPIVSSPYSGAYFSYPFSGNANDVSGNANNGVLTGAPGLQSDRYGSPSSAYTFNGGSQYISTTTSVTAPTTFTISLWFNTTTAGGKLIGFGNAQTGSSGSNDRHIYMSNSGTLYYGVNSSGTYATINTTASYNDGHWHHVIVTQGGSGVGASLYVDGVLQASSTTAVPTAIYTGYWRIAYDNLSSSTWAGAPTNPYFTGNLDDIAVYNSVFSSAQIASSNNVNQIGYPTTNQCLSSPISFSAPTITGATYTWTDAGGNTQTGQNVTFPTGTAGSYTLTVTGGPGGCSSTATVTPTFYAAPSATFNSPASIIMGGTATATYTGTDPSTSQYVWNFAGGSPTSYTGQTPPAVTYATPGSYNISLTVTNTTTGCYTTVTHALAVNTAAPTATSVAQCGAGASLTASGTPGGGVYNWYTAATGGTAIQSGSSAASATLSNIQSTATYYVSYSISGIESARTAVTATINPIITAPYTGAYFSYPFNGNTNDVSSYGNNGSNNGATLTTDRYGAANAAYSFNGTSNYITDPFLDNNPSTYTISIWFNTTSITGGSLIGLESGNYADRLLYMSNSGQVYWGLYPGTVQTINTTASYNDGNWHHVIVTVSSAGSTLYVDGVSQATSATMTTGNGTNGDWQMGYIIASGWTNPPTSNYFSGSLDDIAVYHRVLSATEISTSNNLNQIYVGTGTACSALTFNAPTITGATYTWKDPNNNTQTGQSVSFPGAVAGNYTLTVTGGPGGCSSSVTLTPVIYASSIAAFNVPASIPVSTNAPISLYAGVGSSTYTWNFGSGASPATGTGQGPFSVQWSTTGVKTVTLTVTTSGGCTITSTQNITVTSTASGYVYTRTVTMKNAAVGMSGNVSNFPVLLSIQSSDLIVSGTCADKIQNPTGPNYDFAFFDPSAPTSELYYQVQSYNSTTGTLLVWVRIPTMYAATNNTLAFQYGAKVPPVTHNAAFFSNTWTADYQAVYHFSESGYTGTTADATSNNRTASLAGFSSSNYVPAASGKIGSCYTFGGVADMEAAATSPSSTVTMSAWINTSNTGLDEKVITDENASGDGSGGYKLGVYFGSAETEAVYTLNRGSNTPAEPALSTNTWYYVQGVYDGTTMSTYVNGVQYKKYAVTATSTFTNTLYIGIGESKSYPFSGMIDEPRVSNIAKSSDWILMEYTNQNNPTLFSTLSTNATACNTTYGSAIPGEISYTWTGATSTDPSVASNWNNTATAASALPAFDGSASLVIPAGLSKYPALTAAISVYGLTIANGAQLNLNGNIMSVGCHIYNGSGGQILYGSTSTAGGITFNGSLATQYYYGTTTGIANVANLTVNNSAGGTVDITGGAFGINNMLTLTNGNLFIDNTGSGSLTLLSSATNSGSVAAIPSGFAITGNVNVQRYITTGAGTRGYRLLSSPVNVNSSLAGTGNLGLTYLNTNATFNSTTYYGAYTQGPGTGFTFNGSVHPIIYLYDQSQPTYNGSFTGGKNIGVYTITGSTATPAYGVITQGTSIASTAVNIPIANSYLLYFVGSDQSSVVTNTRVPDATTLTATGYLNQGNVPFVFWKSGSASLPYNVTTGTSNYGLFQIGNPYPSTINLATLYTDNFNSSSNPISPSFYELIPAGNYVSYNASNGHVSDLRASQYVVSGQGFLAQTTATGQTITFKEDQKVAYNSSNPFLESITGPVLADAHIINSIPAKPNKNHALMLSANTNSGPNTGLHVQLSLDSAVYAQTGIYYGSTSSDKYLSSEDAVEVDGGTPQVFLSSYSSDNVKLSINTVGDYGQGKRVPLYVNAVNSGTYTFSLADITNIDTSDYNVFIVDNKLQDSLNIVHSKSYTFALNLSDTTTFGSNRFVLAIDHKPVNSYILATFSGQKVTTGVQLKWTAENAGNYTGYTLQKQNSTGGYDSLYSVQSDASVTAYGFIDTHPIIGNNMYRLQQNGISGAITYSAVVTVGYSSTTPNGALTLYPNPAQSIINVNLTSSTIAPTYVADIYNSMGVKMNHRTVSSATWTDDVSSYKLGVYVMEIKDNNGNIIAQAKFVKVE